MPSAIPTSKSRADLIIKNAVLMTANAENQIVEHGALAIREGRIAALDDSAKLAAGWDAAEVLDVKGAVVHPGFIDAHIHISQYTARSVLPAMARTSGAGGRSISMGHWKSALRPEDEYASAALAGLDMVKSGYTGFVDPGTVFEPEAVASATETIGIRAWLTDPYVADRVDYLAQRIPAFFGGSFADAWPKDLDEAASRIGGQLRRNGDPESLVRGYVGLYGDGTDSAELWTAAGQIARANAVQLQKHFGYSPNVYREFQDHYPGSTIEGLARAGLLGPDVSFVHMNLLPDSDIGILAGSDTRLVWCPYGQLTMIGSEQARGRMADAQRRGIAVGIGSDIARGFNFDDLGKLAQAAAAAAGNPVTADEIFLMRTRDAAASIGADGELGSLEVGKWADLVVRKPDCSEFTGLDPCLETAVLAGRDTVSDVFVAGRPVMKRGEMPKVDEVRVVSAAHHSARSLAERVGLC